jgi:hypothetical protein
MSDYREEPSSMREQFFWECVARGGATMCPELEERLIKWNGPTKEPFLTMWNHGWRKYQSVHRLRGGRNMTIHFWMHPNTGQRAYLKFVSPPVRNPGDMRFRRNADEGARRRERAHRASPAVPTQEEVDRVVLDKLRAGHASEITLYELNRASTGLIPREVLQHSFQDSFDKLWDEPGRDHTLPVETARLEVQGADLTIAEASNTILLMLETPELDPRFVFPGSDGIPRVRLWVNEDVVQTAGDGGWDFQ